MTDPEAKLIMPAPAWRGDTFAMVQNDPVVITITSDRVNDLLEAGQ
jgi:hypothetical protein